LAARGREGDRPCESFPIFYSDVLEREIDLGQSMDTHILVFKFADSIQEHSLYQICFIARMDGFDDCKKKIERNIEFRDESRQGNVKIKK
jgi:hypothetical protein